MSFYQINNFEKLTYATFFKRYFPEMYDPDEFTEDGGLNHANDNDNFGFVNDLRNYVLYKRKLSKDFDKRYVKELKANMTRLMNDKGWKDEFPFDFVSPFDANEEYVCIGRLVCQHTDNIIVGDTLYLID